MENQPQNSRMERPKNNWVTRIWWLYIALHFFGLIGIIWPYTRYVFIPLSPITMLIGFFLLWRWVIPRLRIWLVILSVTGFLIEVVGVSTGKIFGVYYYQTALGPKILEVPPIIGLNWAILVVCCSAIVPATWNKMFRALISGGLMVAIDAFIEPNCCTMDFWCWTTGQPGWENFVGWWLIGSTMSWLWIHVSKDISAIKSKLIAVTGVQWLFFFVLWLFL